MNKKTVMLGLLLVFAATNVKAISTDGNYLLLQSDFTGSGAASWDGNYPVFASVGEPLIKQAQQDNNYFSGIGFWGEPMAAIAAVGEALVAAAKAFIIIVAPLANINFLLFVAGIIVLALFFVFLRGRRESDEEGWEIVYFEEE